MKRMAMIQDGIVQNIAVWDGESPWAPAGYDLIDVTDSPSVDIGYLYNNGEFSPPQQEQGEE